MIRRVSVPLTVTVPVHKLCHKYACLMIFRHTEITRNIVHDIKSPSRRHIGPSVGFSECENLKLLLRRYPPLRLLGVSVSVIRVNSIVRATSKLMCRYLGQSRSPSNDFPLLLCTRSPFFYVSAVMQLGLPNTPYLVTPKVSCERFRRYPSFQ